MRTIVVLLMLLAAGKVTVIEWLYRSASDDVIVNAYRPRALTACGDDARRLAVAGGDALWSPEVPIRLEIGTRTGTVRFWQVDDPAWAARFRNPYLLIEAGPPAARVRCAYDIMNGTAIASKA